MADFNFGQMRQDVLTVPTGDFVVRCTKVDVSANSKTQEPMLKTQLEVIAGPFTGRKFTNNFNIMPSNPSAFAMFFRQMLAFGFDEAYFNALPNGDAGVAQVARDLVGKVVEVNVGVRQWQGADQPDIKSFKPAPAQLGGVGANATALPTALPGATAQPVSNQPVTGAASITLPSPSVATPTEPSSEPPATPF